MNTKEPTLTRSLDIILAVIGTVLLSPLFVLIFILAYLDTKSPLFIQTRVGKNKKPFKLIKFRTMHPNSKSVATHLVSNCSITPLGSFLRKAKLDELPQLYNVLKGEMSLVGPRPCLPSQKELIDARTNRDVFSVLPGITGLAQVNKIDMSKPEQLSQYDQKMILEMKLGNYFQYLFLTLFGRGKGDNVQRR